VDADSSAGVEPICRPYDVSPQLAEGALALEIEIHRKGGRSEGFVDSRSLLVAQVGERAPE
jgi:hypothetical protein